MLRQTIGRWLGAIASLSAMGVMTTVTITTILASGLANLAVAQTGTGHPTGAKLQQPAKLAIVIDDIGYNELRGMRTIRLPGPLTLAVLPFAPHTRALVPHALDADKDIIIHQPMEPHPSPTVREEVGTLKLSMSEQEFDRALAGALAAVPESIGLSNHTGSLLTSHTKPMARVMRRLGQHNMFFLDSRTTADTVALQVAQEHGVPAVRRDVFLDHTATTQAIHQSFQQALRIASKKGHAVLVGHPYPVTLDYLEQALRNLPANIELVGAAELAQRLPASVRGGALLGNALQTPNYPGFATLRAHPTKLVPQQHPVSLRISLGQ